MRALLVLALGTSLLPLGGSPPGVSPSDAAEGRVPFQVGERLGYQAKINFLSAGSASMDVVGTETIRGHPCYHTVFDVKGGVFFFHANDHYESWFDTTTLVSYRHVQHMDENGSQSDRTYEFYPERRVYVRNGEENPS